MKFKSLFRRGNGSNESNRSKKEVSSAKSVDSLATNLISAEGNHTTNTKGLHEEKTPGSDYAIETEKDLLLSCRDLEILQLKEKLYTQDSENRKLHLEVASLQNQKEEKERLESAVSSMRYKYEDTIEQLKKQIETVDKEKMDVLRQRISLESIVKSLELKFKTTEEEKEDYKMQCLKAKKDHDTVFSSYTQLQEHSTIQTETLKNELLEQKQKTQTLKNELLEQEQKTQILTNELLEKEAEIVTLKNQVLGRETDINILKNQILEKETNINTLTNQLSKNETDLKTLENLLSKKEMDMNSLTSQLTEKITEIDALKTQGKEMEQNLMEEESIKLENQILQKELEIQELKNEMNELEQKLEEEKKLIEQERVEWQEFEDDMLVVVKVADRFRFEAEIKADSLGKDILILKEKLEDLLECNVETKNVGVQITSSTSKTPLVRTHSQSSINSYTESSSSSSTTNNNNNNSSDSSAKLSESNGYDVDFSDKENKSIDSHESNNNNNYTKELEKSSSQIIKPLAHSDSKRNTNNAEPDALDLLAHKYGSRRKALMIWAQSRTSGYREVEIDNFSASWNDGIAFCALLHSYVPNQVPYDSLKPENRETNLNIASNVAKSLGVTTELDMNAMLQERPPWSLVICYLTDIYNRMWALDL